MQKTTPKKIYAEQAYVLGLFILALGTAFMERADFGLSMVVAPAYLIYLKLSETIPFFTFGMAEYLLQAFILIVMVILLKKPKLSYIFSFITAVIYGFTLDGIMALLSFIPGNAFIFRLLFFVAGMLLCALGVSLLFHTYLAPEAYELFVKEVSENRHLNIHKFKTCYDLASCLISIILSFIFFGLWHFEGIKAATILCAFTNGFIISRFTHYLESHWVFVDKFNARRFFS